jgi:hypothetical protein
MMMSSSFADEALPSWLKRVRIRMDVDVIVNIHIRYVVLFPSLLRGNEFLFDRFLSN